MDRICFRCSAKLADLVVRTSMAKRVARGYNLQRKERRRTVKALTVRDEASRSGTLKRMRRSSGGHSEQRRP